MWGRLQTRDRLRKRGLQVESNFPLCGLEDETANHLLVQYSYARRCIVELNRTLQISPQLTDLESLGNWLHKPTAGRFKCPVIQCMYAAPLYNILMQRNSAVWQGSIKHYNKVVQQIKTEVWMRIQGVMPKKVQDKDKDWLRQS
ncbi:Ciliogenesis and planar polarity effector 1 [Bienertia sinuspersici]